MAEKPMPLMTEKNRAAIRAGLKSQTRRVIVPQPPAYAQDPFESDGGFSFYDHVGRLCFRCKPRYAVDDELWMREPFEVYAKLNSALNTRMIQGDYLDDGDVFCQTLTKTEWDKFCNRKTPYAKTSGMFMYKSLARKWVKVKRVWVEQTQDISAEDCMAEGCYLGSGEPNIEWDELWDSINKKRGYGWDVNTYNFGYEFERIEK